MQKLIHFRSKIESHLMSEGGRKSKGLSADISSIRGYIPGDDPRDILWKKSAGTGNIYSRDREYTRHPSVHLISLLDTHGSDFSTITYPETKNNFIHELDSALSTSAKKLRFRYQASSGGSGEIQGRERGILLILCDIDTIELARKYFPLSKKHDVIFLFLLHPGEIPFRETLTLMFESGKISNTYENIFKASIHQWEYECSSHGVALIPCTTVDDPSLLLNHFFKYRYV